MATTIGHGAVGVTGCLAVTVLPFGFNVIPNCAALMSSIYVAYHMMQPDIIGIKGGSARGEWEVYNSAHFGAIREKVRALPWWRVDKWIYLFHTDVHDPPFHEKPPKVGWKKIGVMYEIVEDLLILTALYFMVGLIVTICIVAILSMYFLITKLNAT